MNTWNRATKEEVASAWGRGILGAQTVAEMCKKRGWDFKELEELMKKIRLKKFVDNMKTQRR